MNYQEIRVDGELVALAHDASPESVSLVLQAPLETGDGRSEWTWLRLMDGDLMLGVFPQGATYEAVEEDAAYPGPPAPLVETGELWHNSRIQFARLLCEIVATDALDGAIWDTLLDSMGLESDDLTGLFDRANDTWERAKADLAPKPKDAGPRYIIRSDYKDPEDGFLYWSNEDGWGSLTTATIFTQAQRDDGLALPLEASGWVNIDKVEPNG